VKASKMHSATYFLSGDWK